MIVHETARLVLREFVADDAPHLFALADDPAVVRQVGAHRLDDVDAYRERIATLYRPQYARVRGGGFFAAVDRATGDFVGWFHLRPALEYRYADLAGYRAGDLDVGYCLRPATWGRGLATEGAAALVDAAFARLGAARVVASAVVTNVASCRVLEKVGLAKASDWRLPDGGAAAWSFVRARLDV